MRASSQRPARKADEARAGASPAPWTLDTPVAALAGIGPKRAAALADRGIATLQDLVFHLPARYQDWRARVALRDLAAGTIAVVEGQLGDIKERPMRGAPWRRLASGLLTEDGGAQIRLVWFNLPAYMRGRMPSGDRVLAHGRVAANSEGSLEIVQPELFALSSGEPPPIRAVYGLPAGVPQRLFSNLVAQALDAIGHEISGAVPDDLRTEYLPIGEALRMLHSPPADANLDLLQDGESPGHLALGFDELFAFELALSIERARSARRKGIALDEALSLSTRWLRELPFAPTASQACAIDEIAADLAQPGQMNRMLMGDVGSGKTLVAFWAALRAVECGYQAAMMAPTELLAEQHFASFQRQCGSLGVTSALLTGGIGDSARSSILRGLASGAIAMVFGTHALIQERVRIAKLGLGVIDEQHRFGVFDRARLKALGPAANVLMMTATPIPRSLAMSLFANLDVSFLDELPPGRTPVTTEIFTEDDLERVDTLVRGEIERGNRAYYVLPMIDSPEEEIRSVAAMAKRLARGRLANFRVGTMHGRMRAAEKDRVMREFRDGAIDALVSTTVVEVGIDVPEATVIVIVGAERYGLAQLHQLRGRVGRGAVPSRCILVASRDADEKARDRIRVMASCATGAEVAEADLKMRGPGDLLGARQAGALPLRFVHLIRDWRLIEKARTMADEWLRRDPRLESPSSEGARAALRRMLSLGFSLADVG
ncbi:MAG TPA: ATP-dependent DNA helicase RecG [Candidatus Binataceae bacterium]|nr:ATP-dependent DNA helicase RecG [Candidatus Binataceae bacterium]